MEVLPLALPSPARELSEAEKQRMEDQEENTLRELRLFLRDVTKRLATDKRFNIFSKPVDIEEVLFQWCANNEVIRKRASIEKGNGEVNN